MNKPEVLGWCVIIGIPMMLLTLFALIVLQPYFEAMAFNKFTTGPKATYWDAVWTELRVTPR